MACRKGKHLARQDGDIVQSHAKACGYARKGAGLSYEQVEYMDEAQSEVTKSSVTFKVFKFEGTPTAINEKGKEEQTENAKAAEAACKAFKESQTDKIWSDIGHTDKMYFVAYCRSGELASKAVKAAGEYYNLNVELTAGYIIGTNWATCH